MEGVSGVLSHVGGDQRRTEACIIKLGEDLQRETRSTGEGLIQEVAKVKASYLKAEQKLQDTLLTATTRACSTEEKMQHTLREATNRHELVLKEQSRLQTERVLAQGELYERVKLTLVDKERGIVELGRHQ